MPLTCFSPSVTLQRHRRRSFMRQKRSSICTTFASSCDSISTIAVFDSSRLFSCSKSLATALAGCGGERLVDVAEDVVERLDAHRHAHHVGRDAGLELLLLAHLAVRGRGRVDDERLRVADVGEVREELRRLDELLAGLGAS